MRTFTAVEKSEERTSIEVVDVDQSLEDASRNDVVVAVGEI
jgi:hypothetical protein